MEKEEDVMRCPCDEFLYYIKPPAPPAVRGRPLRGRPTIVEVLSVHSYAGAVSQPTRSICRLMAMNERVR